MIEPARLEPEALYDDAAIKQALGLTPSTLRRARQSEGLRFTRKGQRNLYLGRWVQAWLTGEDAANASTAEPARVAS